MSSHRNLSRNGHLHLVFLNVWGILEELYYWNRSHLPEPRAEGSVPLVLMKSRCAPPAWHPQARPANTKDLLETSQGTFLWLSRPGGRSRLIWSQTWIASVLQSNQGPMKPSGRTERDLWPVAATVFWGPYPKTAGLVISDSSRTGRQSEITASEQNGHGAAFVNLQFRGGNRDIGTLFKELT